MTFERRAASAISARLKLLTPIWPTLPAFATAFEGAADLAGERNAS
jgi:hypothetical protein